VALAHAWLTWEVAQQMQKLGPGEGGIKRMEATYVSEIKLSRPPTAPAVVTPPAPAAPTKTPRKRKKPVPVKAASAPEELASAPMGEQVASAVLAAASDTQPEPPTPAASEPAPDTAASAAAATAASAATSAAGPAFVWPRATRVTYKLEGYFRGPIYGQASVEWVRQGERYQVHVDASVGPSFAPLGSWRLTSEGSITPAGLEPSRYENLNRLLIKSSPVSVITFEGDEVVLPNGKRLPRAPGMQDPASQFIQLAYRFIMNPGLLKVGNTIEMPMAWLKKSEMLAYDVIDEQMLHTPIGDVPTVHVRPRRMVAEKDKVTAEIWFAPGLQYLPVRILTRLDEQTFMDMQMDRAPQQAPGDGGASAPAP
jgi:hypothetical protein